MWSADLAKRGDSQTVTLPEQARLIAHEIVAGLYQHWRVQPVAKGRVAAALPPEVMRPVAPPVAIAAPLLAPSRAAAPVQALAR